MNEWPNTDASSISYSNIIGLTPLAVRLELAAEVKMLNPNFQDKGWPILIYICELSVENGLEIEQMY